MTAAAGAAIGVDREYETIYVLRPDVEKKRAEDVSSRMTDVIGRGGGKLTRVENWGRRLLAYPVERHKRGVYVYLRYIGHGELVSEIECNLRMLDSVIKFQTVKLAELVSAAATQVSEEDLKFEHVEPPEEEEEAPPAVEDAQALPAANHSNVTRLAMVKHCMSTESTFSARTKPP